MQQAQKQQAKLREDHASEKEKLNSKLTELQDALKEETGAKKEMEQKVRELEISLKGESDARKEQEQKVRTKKR